MKKLEIEILSETINSPIVHMPGRRFPGVVIQGDSLKNLFNLSEEITTLANNTTSVELIEASKELKDLIAGYIKSYESTMRHYGKDLPY